MAALDRPVGLGDEEWAAIDEAESRLLRARTASDAPLVVGSAKELCEAVAKVVITERGELPTGGAAMPELITAAHKLLEFQPGEGLASDPESRKVAQGLKSIVLGISEMRNRHGTGHGRSAPSGITAEHAELVFEASLLWATWILRRLGPYIAGDVTALVRDLEREIFHRGDLRQRLTFANLARLSIEDQMRVGVAVARRASRGTVVVAEDGIDAVRPEDSASWPAGYVEGLLTGLSFDADGYVYLNGWKVRECARLVAGLRDPVPVLERLALKAAQASTPRRVAADEGAGQSVVEEFQRAAHLVPQGGPRELWLTIGQSLYPALAAPSE